MVLPNSKHVKIATETMTDIADWYKNIPYFTKHWMTGSVVFTLLGRFGIVKPINLILLYEPLKRFEIWRLVTSVLYYPASFHYLINLYFLYNYSRRLETGE